MMSLFLLVNMISCNEEVLIFEDENIQYEIDFFNLIFYDDENRIKACQYLMNSEEIELEKEPLAKNSYYIYADDRLFQEIAIENKWAKINLNYPEYLHQIKEDKMTMNESSKYINRNNHSILILVSLFFVFLISSFIFVLLSKL